MKNKILFAAIAGIAVQSTAHAQPQVTPVPHVPVIVNPDWLHKPTANELARAWPMLATQHAVRQGQAVMKCVVTTQGLLDQCVVLRETPPGLGFGPSALQLAPLMLMKPKTVDGLPVGNGEVTIPMTFVYPGDITQESTNTVSYQIGRVIWLKAPTALQVAAAFPRNAIGKIQSGHVVLRCGFSRQGGLTNCTAIEERPKLAGFADAARSLIKSFQADITPFAAKAPDTQIDIPIHFIDPNSEGWRERTLAQPTWIAGPTHEDVESVFPAEARAAAVWSGLGIVSCEVAQGGKLDQCQIAGEQPARLGFGPAALKLAPSMAMNSWTVEGMPADGVRIQVPIRLISGPPPTPSTKP